MAFEGIIADPWARSIAGLMAGAIAGSFLATLAIRWPAGRSIAAGRSCCDACSETLRPFELIPLLSFAYQRGRCRRCRVPIAQSHVWIEAIAALIGGASLALRPGWVGAMGALMGWFLLVIAAIDLRHFWIPDRLTLPFLLFGPIAAWMAGTPSLADSLIGAAVGWLTLAAIAAVYRRVRGRVGIGGGDPKLFAGIGAWIGWQSLPLVLLAASLLGLATALVLHLRGREIAMTTQLPLGTLLAAAAWPIWLAVGS